MPHTPLAGEQHQAIDDTPLVTCGDCGRTETWEDATDDPWWQFAEDDSNSADENVCPQCRNKRFRTTMRGLLNHSLTDYRRESDDE